MSMDDLVLGVDASANSLYIALKGKGICVDREFVSIRNTDNVLLDEIVRLLNYANVKLDDLSYIALGEGPGSFTSLRIAASTLKGLTFSKGIKIKSVPTLDALYRSFQKKTDRVVVPLIDARMHRFYTALYKNGRKLTKDSDLSLEDILNLTPENITFVYHPLEFNNIVALIGNDTLQKYENRVSFAPKCLINNPGFSLIDLSYSKDFDDEAKGPLYVREHSGLIRS